MSDNGLSQEQIDSLFEGGADAVDDYISKEDGNDDFQNYDFNRPDKFNLENIRSLISIANVFSRGFSQTMSASLRTNINFTLNKGNSVSQIPYSNEYIKELAKDFFAFCITDLGNRDLGMVIIEVDIALGLAIQRNLLGAGKSLIFDENRRSITEIEKIAMEEWVQEKIFPNLEESFQNIAHFNLKLDKIETDPQLVKVTRDTDMIAIIAFDIEYGPENNKEKMENAMRIAIPYLSIEPIIDRLTPENSSVEYKNEKSEESQSHILQTHLNWIKQDIDVELGKSKIKVKELLSLEDGDVLVLNKKINDDLLGYVSNKPKFSCTPGKSGNKVAVKITNFAEREALENE